MPAADMQDQREPGVCAYRGTKDPSKRVAFQLFHNDSVEQAAASIAEMRENLKLAKQTPAGSGAKEAFVEIPDVGDAAIWTSMNGILTAHRANISIEVSYPADNRDGQIAVAKKVLAGL